MNINKAELSDLLLACQAADKLTNAFSSAAMEIAGGFLIRKSPTLQECEREDIVGDFCVRLVNEQSDEEYAEEMRIRRDRKARGGKAICKNLELFENEVFVPSPSAKSKEPSRRVAGWRRINPNGNIFSYLTQMCSFAASDYFRKRTRIETPLDSVDGMEQHQRDAVESGYFMSEETRESVDVIPGKGFDVLVNPKDGQQAIIF